ncbi:helix-turn-helix domain-containing protein [Marinobacter sp.]|uniref:helix-turn-helix domain-containing protein n=1 Tax=Marinobacter sp. TaxID=50741 RepID=UPI003B516879
MNMQAGSTYAAVVGAVIAKLRADKGIGQADLASAVGLGQPAWSRIEKGGSALTVDQLARAARALKLSPSDIVSMADKTVAKMKAQNFEVSYEKPHRPTLENDNTGLLLLGGAALAALIIAANNK